MELTIQVFELVGMTPVHETYNKGPSIDPRGTSTNKV